MEVLLVVSESRFAHTPHVLLFELTLIGFYLNISAEDNKSIGKQFRA